MIPSRFRESFPVTLFAELRRRNVLRVSLGYVVIAWLILQVADTLAPALRLPEWVNSFVALLLVLGFPLAVFLAWAFELTPQGIVREPAEDPQPDDTSASIAVLPFRNLSGDDTQVWFSDGLSQELLALLATIQQLRVVSQSSSFAYRDQNLHISKIGELLRVGHILEGSVRKSGNRVRITAQLIDVSDDRTLWVHTWDRDLVDIFQIQNEIASSVVNALAIELLGAPPVARTTKPEAYSLYLRARHALSESTLHSYQLAEDLIERALEVDPEYAPAWVRLGYIYTEQAKTGLRDFREGYRRARDAVHRALLIEPEGKTANGLMAEIAMRYDRDFDAARRHIAAALLTSPDDLENNVHAANVYHHLGDYDRAARYAEQAVAVDPSYSPALIIAGFTYLFMKRYDDAISAFTDLKDLNPDAFGSRFFLGMALMLSGAPQRALSLIVDEPFDVYRETGLALVYHTLENHAEADAALARLIQHHRSIGPYQIAEVYGWRGEATQALDWLERAIEVYDTGVIMILGDPTFDSVRGTERFTTLLSRLGLGTPDSPTSPDRQ